MIEKWVSKMYNQLNQDDIIFRIKFTCIHRDIFYSDAFHLRHSIPFLRSQRMTVIYWVY